MPSLAEKRSAEQFPVNAGTSCSFVAPVVEHFGAATGKSLSMDAVGLLLTRRVEPGVVLAVSLCNPGKRFAKTLLVRVAHVDPAPGGYLVSGAFVTPLVYQELTTLVL
jgi:hypothetical protein